jgi:hypothetical protein
MRNDLLREIRESTSTIGQARNEMIRDINELKQGMNAISTKIVGTGIGNVSEKTVMKDLKSAMCNTLDSFSDERALKKGTDIVSTVRDKGRDCGKISISERAFATLEPSKHTRMLPWDFVLLLLPSKYHNNITNWV